MQEAIFNWSGGKDSALCLYKVIQQKEFTVSHLLTSVNAQYSRVSMHGVRLELLHQQAQSIGLPLHQLLLPEMPDMYLYEQQVLDTHRFFGNQGIHYAIYGDIFLEDLRHYREKLLAKASWQAVFPLWNIPTKDLMQEFIDLGFKAIIVCVNNQYLHKSFAGRIIDNDFIKDLPANVDVCGENGEYHSFVYDGPIFNTPIPFTIGETIYRTYQSPSDTDQQNICSSADISPFSAGFWYTDLLPK
jgi:uncharacterized protein (TIGR00290 family)